MAEHPYGWLSLVPPLLAIALAIATHRATLSLLAGVLAGALITTGGNPLRAAYETVVLHLWPALADPGKLLVFGFTLSMGAMIGIITASGGMRGLVALMIPWAKSRRRGQLVTWFLGLLIFFDDYANTVLLGSTLRPLCQRLKISREKLAYLVDSTAAPVAGLALVSTWIAVEVDYIQEGLDNLPAAVYHVDSDSVPNGAASRTAAANGAGGPRWPTAFDLFVTTIPYRFYVIWALVFVPLIALTARDFGPMLAAEQREVGQRPETHSATPPEQPPWSATDLPPARWFNAVVPIAACLAVIVSLMYFSGKSNLGAEAGGASLRDIFGRADSSRSLLAGSLAGVAVASLLATIQRLLGPRSLIRAALLGARTMVPALLILWMATSLSKMTGNMPIAGVQQQSRAGQGSALAKDGQNHATSTGARSHLVSYRLYTGQYLTQLLGGRLAPWMLPSIVFVLASVVALATGTSYGTMGILMPMTIPLSYNILASGGTVVSPDHPVFLASLSGVLAGAIFGDHCSPISDTTVLSSQASGCDHVAHVWTQMPYALCVALVSIVCGTLPVALGASVWLLLPLGGVVLAILLRCIGQRVEH